MAHQKTYLNISEHEATGKVSDPELPGRVDAPEQKQAPKSSVIIRDNSRGNKHGSHHYQYYIH